MPELDQLINSLVASSPNIPFSVPFFTLSLLLTTVCAYILEKFFINFGVSISNRKKLGNNFTLISMTTTLIITIVRSSLALSLGLVGALSIVRFRTAIKEPEELAYLFLAIALGLGFGAGQIPVTLLAYAIILGVLILRYRHRRHRQGQENLLYLSITSPKPKTFSLSKLISVLRPYSKQLDLKRRDEDTENLDIAFYVIYKNVSEIDASFQAIRDYLPKAKIACLDQSSLML